MKRKSRVLAFFEVILFLSVWFTLVSVACTKSSFFQLISGWGSASQRSGNQNAGNSYDYKPTKPRQQQIPKSDEQRLLQDLTRCYDKSTRPLGYAEHKVLVKFYLKLVQIIEVNEKRQQITLNVWATQKWRNMALTWNPEEYGGTDVINVDPSLVWFPEILLHNNAEEQFSGGTHKYKTKIILTHDGNQTWFSTASFTSTCIINVKRFPFDEQKCELKFGPWSHDSESIDVETDETEADISNYLPNGEWDLVSFPAVKQYTKYGCCKTPFADITFTLHIRRKTLYYFYNLIAPCFLITLLITMGFYLPPASGQRVTLCITVLFSMTVFLNVANNKLPVTSDHVPLIAKLYMACILQMILSTASSCIVLHCYHRNHETSYLPLWLTKILVPKLATLLYVDNSAYKRRKTIDVGVQTDFTEDNYSNNVSIVADPLDFQLIPLNTTFETLTSIPELESSTDSLATKLTEADREFLPLYPAMSPFHRLRPLPSIGEISAIRNRYSKTRGIKRLVDAVKKRKLKAEHELEMEFVARVLDRLCIVGFFVILIISVVVICIE